MNDSNAEDSVQPVKNRPTFSRVDFSRSKANFPGLIEGESENIGPYKLLYVLGEGGFAVVYLAEQSQPVKRRVALKLIKPGMDTKQVIARFNAEQQAMAYLDHPNIAQIYDAGKTKTGRPYFVMEYIEGVPITQYCDEQKLRIEERLQLFMQVCDGIEHAHKKGIIHRDLKPSNVLVVISGEKAIVKIIDFGIAKALAQPLTERTLFTEQGQLIGTPGYMSPEQAVMTAQGIDTRSDIYSLGVLLYELLTGTLPFTQKTLELAGFAEIQRIIREEDPPHPSTKLSRLGEDAKDVARCRRTKVATLTRCLQKELEWIPLKAMEKDRTRRYESAHTLAQDIVRYLNHEPILARAPGKIYRLKKYLRRHQSQAVAVACVVFFFLLSLSVVWTHVRSGNQKHQAKAVREDIMSNVRIPRKAEDYFAYKSLQKYLVGIFHSRKSQYAWRLTYSEIARTLDLEKRGTWLIGNGLTKDGNAYEITAQQGRWYPRKIPPEEAAELGVSGESTRNKLNYIMQFPTRKLVTLQKAELSITESAGIQILNGRVYCTNKLPQKVEHLALVCLYPVPEEGNLTRRLYQHINSNIVRSGWLNVSIQLDQNANLEYGSRLFLEAYLARPTAGFFQISNELIITIDRLGPSKLVTR
jgi:serine/threonine protein kinase